MWLWGRPLLCMCLSGTSMLTLAPPHHFPKVSPLRHLRASTGLSRGGGLCEANHQRVRERGL